MKDNREGQGRRTGAIESGEGKTSAGEHERASAVDTLSKVIASPKQNPHIKLFQSRFLYPALPHFASCTESCTPQLMLQGKKNLHRKSNIYDAPT